MLKSLFCSLGTVTLFSTFFSGGTSYATEATQPNILLICVDDLRPELASFGKDYIHSPNMDRLAKEGRAFNRHYVNSPSCGPSRYTLLTGRYGGPTNNALIHRAAQLNSKPESVPASMPEWFREHGYTTVSVGKVSHHPGGWGGEDWSDQNLLEMPKAWDATYMPFAEWQSAKGAMHGLANGEVNGKYLKIKNSKKMDALQSVEGPDTLYPDGFIAEEGLKQLKALASQEQPFFLAIGLLKPHLPFGAPAKYMEYYDGVDLPAIEHPNKPEGKTTWHGSSEFKSYNLWGEDPNQDPTFADEIRRHYAACVSYVDKHVGDILETLKATGAENNTIIVLWGDHGWHLGEHGIWGKHSLFEESLRAPLVVTYPGITHPGEHADAVVSSIDIFPTLCELAQLEVPEFATGVSLKAIVEDPSVVGHFAVGYGGKLKAQTLRTATHRLVLHPKGEVELYDHTTPEKETVNIAVDQPERVEVLKQQLKEAYFQSGSKY